MFPYTCEYGVFPYTWNNVWGLCSAQMSALKSEKGGHSVFLPSVCNCWSNTGLLSRRWWRGWKSEGWASSLPHSALKSLLFPHSFCVHDLLLKSRGGNDPRRGGGKRALPVRKQGWHFRETESWIWNCHEQRIPSKEIAHCSATGSPVTMGTGQRMTAGRSHLSGLKTRSDHLTTMIQAPPD